MVTNSTSTARATATWSALDLLRFQREEGGVRRIDVAMQDSDVSWTERFEVAKARSGADGTEETIVRMSTGATRNGVIELDGHRIPFRLSGSSGRYGVLGTHVAFDRQDNGKFESYKPSDRWVNLAEQRPHEFHVDPQGAFVTLKESDSRAERSSSRNWHASCPTFPSPISKARLTHSATDPAISR